MTTDERPPVACFVARQLTESRFLGPFLVSLETAADLHALGWIVVGPDPHSEQMLAEYERAQEWMQSHKPKWFDQDDGA